MKLKYFAGHISGVILIIIISYISSCDSRTGITEPPPPIPNPYGEGNGKITFYRTQNTAGPVVISISNKQFNDFIIW